MKFEDLSVLIHQTHLALQDNAVKAVNRALTMRNWLIGYYIVEFEQHGEDRAAYGEQLLKNLEWRVAEKGLNETLFKVSRRFYQEYPQIAELFPMYSSQIRATLSTDLQKADEGLIRTVDEIRATLSPQLLTSAEKLVANLSFSHIREVLTVDNPLQRFFYETECIKCGWSVRELRRQISTRLYERCSMSRMPQELLSGTKSNCHHITEDIKQPFTFEFLGLNPKHTVEERDLEQGLIDHLQEFLMELGKGFCFEARQRRIIIDDRYYYADLVFYHRLLHCHVIIELKNDEFRHEHLGQLNAYVSYYKENEMQPGDNPPVGILLCTRKGKKMVEYAIAGMDNTLFVSTYLLQLPDKKELEEFIVQQSKEIS